MPTLWQYESFVQHEIHPETLRETLNSYGKTGYQVLHVKEQKDGGTLFLLGRDTGRPIDEDDEQVKEWMLDDVTSENAHLKSAR